jgi:hypothetical protein
MKRTKTRSCFELKNWNQIPYLEEKEPNPNCNQILKKLGIKLG